VPSGVAAQIRDASAPVKLVRRATCGVEFAGEAFLLNSHSGCDSSPSKKRSTGTKRTRIFRYASEAFRNVAAGSSIPVSRVQWLLNTYK